MMKNSTDTSLNKKLKAYSAVAGSFLISGNVANAAIVYTDVNPDAVITQTNDGTQSYGIDLNNDGINDFRIDVHKGLFYGQYAFVEAFGLNTGNSFLSTTSSVYPTALAINQSIKSTSGTWSAGTNAGYLAGKFGTSKGSFFAAQNKYLAVRFTVGANTSQYYYGWIRVSVSSNADSFTVYDFAYETTADATTMKTPALAGLTTKALTGITDNSASSGGTIGSDGGVPVLEKGVCWSEHAPPTIADNKTSDGAGKSSYTSFLSGLKPNTTYYVRSFATTIVGTAYGSQITFTTAAATSINNSLSANTIIKNINNILTADFSNSVQGRMELLNVSGVVVKSADFNGNTWELNLQDMVGGIYIVRISNDEGYLVKKVLVY